MRILVLGLVALALVACTNVLEGPNDCTKIGVEYPDYTGSITTDTSRLEVVDGIVYREVSYNVPGYDSVALIFTYNEACLRDTAIVAYTGSN